MSIAIIIATLVAGTLGACVIRCVYGPKGPVELGWLVPSIATLLIAMVCGIRP